MPRFTPPSVKLILVGSRAAAALISDVSCGDECGVTSCLAGEGGTFFMIAGDSVSGKLLFGVSRREVTAL